MAMIAIGTEPNRKKETGHDESEHVKSPLA
jgi:hypothetical protein